MGLFSFIKEAGEKLFKGVRGVRLRPNDLVIGMDVISNDSKKVLVISKNGYGKMTNINLFAAHKRDSIDIKAATVTAKTGLIITARTINNDVEELLIKINKKELFQLYL